MSDEAGRVNLGIIGLEHTGSSYIDVIGRFGEFNLVAVCDRRKELSRLAPEGTKFFSDYQQLLEEPGVETVVVATTNHTHYIVARRALEAGKHVLLEKPAAESMHEIGRLEKAAKSLNLTIYYAMHAANALEVEWFADFYRDRANRAELGPVTGFVSRFYDPYVQRGSLLPEAEGLQDCWLDSGINALSVVRKIGIGQLAVEKASVALNHRAKPRFFECNAQLSFPIDGRDRAGVGIIDTNWAAGWDHKSTIVQFARSGNFISMDHSLQKVFRCRPDGKDVELASLSGGMSRLYNHYAGLLKDYLKHRKNGRMNAAEAHAVHELLFEADKAINLVL